MCLGPDGPLISPVRDCPPLSSQSHTSCTAICLSHSYLAALFAKCTHGHWERYHQPSSEGGPLFFMWLYAEADSPSDKLECFVSTCFLNCPPRFVPQCFIIYNPCLRVKNYSVVFKRARPLDKFWLVSVSLSPFLWQKPNFCVFI